MNGPRHKVKLAMYSNLGGRLHASAAGEHQHLNMWPLRLYQNKEDLVDGSVCVHHVHVFICMRLTVRVFIM